MEEDADDRSERELIDMMDDIQYNKGLLRKDGANPDGLAGPGTVQQG
jgi:hypothetical protein